MNGFSRNMTQIRYAARVFFLWIGNGRPSVLWRCFIDNLRYLLVKRGVPSGAAKHVAQIRSAFEENAARASSMQYTSMWTTGTLCSGVLP